MGCRPSQRRRRCHRQRRRGHRTSPPRPRYPPPAYRPSQVGSCGSVGGRVGAKSPRSYLAHPTRRVPTYPWLRGGPIGLDLFTRTLTAATLNVARHSPRPWHLPSRLAKAKCQTVSARDRQWRPGKFRRPGLAPRASLTGPGPVETLCILINQRW